MDLVIGYHEFLDGSERTVYRDDRGQYVFDNDGYRVYGMWVTPRSEQCDGPLSVESRPGEPQGNALAE
jgi:hypothetical protein